MRTTDRLALATMGAMVLATVSMLALTSDRLLLAFGIGLVAVLMVISAGARRLRVGSWLVHLWQLLVVAGVGLGLGLSAQPASGSWLQQLGQLYLEAVLTIRTESAPMEANGAVRWLFLIILGLVTILMDLLVLTLSSPAWSLAPLVSVYLIPALALPGGVSWWVFALLASGYLVILAADTANRLGTWTRNLVTDSAERTHSRWGVWRMAAVVGIPVLAAAIAAGSLLPTFGTLDLDARRPRGNGPIQLVDPTIELQKNLAQQSERVVMTYTSNSPTGEYIRLTSLSQIDRTGWKLTPMQLSTGSLPQPPGVSSTRRTTTQINVGDFSTQYLPAPYAPDSFQATGEWAWDRNTLTLVSTAANGTESTRNLSYEVTSVDTDPNPQQFNEAIPGAPADAAVTAQVPSDVPAEIAELAASITKDAPTPVLKAAAIQEYLRDPRRFTYSTTAPAGDGYEVIANFLLRDKAGYCIHFASAMALMARLEGIPSRVAVGFLPGEKTGDQWRVRGRNMHAWPELYFAGFGWVRFEPTAAVADAPMWTVTSPLNQPTPSSSTSQQPSSDPTSSSSASAPSSDPSASQSTAAPVSGGTGFVMPWAQVIGATGGLAVVALLAVTPLLVRRSIRRGRLHATGDPHHVVAGWWEEARDTLVDSGTDWPEGSPRGRAAAAAPGLGTEAAGALSRLALAVEHSRYARTMDDLSPDLADDIRFFTHEVREHETGLRGLAATLWPRSLWVNLGRWLSGVRQ
ncbi:transglutaminaseTgpA domain-containing protein [Aestuariimicrobium kwangyangense]|uniref:transglutaminase family protein n=1 Tax=Aestuariimicrobium kwangyangense TaxID=396389 RepID=UPI0003B710E1|nr:DUF3488 and transglutaminase-like domain-containing protein [Aestuariimicrobium kwangyangense]